MSYSTLFCFLKSTNDLRVFGRKFGNFNYSVLSKPNASADVCADVWHLKKKTCHNIVRQDFKEKNISLNFKTRRRKFVKTSNVKILKKVKKKLLKILKKIKKKFLYITQRRKSTRNFSTFQNLKKETCQNIERQDFKEN